MKVTGVQDCGNSPKNRLLADFMVALIGADRPALDLLADDTLRFRIAGGREVTGLAAAIENLHGELPRPLRELRIRHAISHGRAGAVDGELHDPKGERIEFSAALEFPNLKATRVSMVTLWLAAGEGRATPRRGQE